MSHISQKPYSLSSTCYRKATHARLMCLPQWHVSPLCHHPAPPWSGRAGSYRAWRPSVDLTWWWVVLDSSGWTAALTCCLCSASGDIKRCPGCKTSVTESWLDKRSKVPKNSQEDWLVLEPRYRPGLSERAPDRFWDGSEKPRSLKNSLPPLG